MFTKIAADTAVEEEPLTSVKLKESKNIKTKNLLVKKFKFGNLL